VELTLASAAVPGVSRDASRGEVGVQVEEFREMARRVADCHPARQILLDILDGVESIDTSYPSISTIGLKKTYERRLRRFDEHSHKFREIDRLISALSQHQGELVSFIGIQLNSGKRGFVLFDSTETELLYWSDLWLL
jgi:hypothetical protein